MGYKTTRRKLNDDFRKQEQDRKAIEFAGLVSALVDCEVWFRQASDGEEGVHWQNGESSKYHGDAWDQAEKIRKKINRALDAVR